MQSAAVIFLYYGPHEIRKITLLTRDLVANETSCYRTYNRGQAQLPEQNSNRGGKETPGWCAGCCRR